MSSPIVESGWLYATVPIDNQYGKSGTGFLVARNVTDEHLRVFLLTNKHVVCGDPARRSTTQFVICHFNTKEDDGKPGTMSVKVPLMRADGNSRYREHPDPDTDVAAIDVTDVIVLNPKLEKRWVEYEGIATEAKRNELEITAGEEIITIGYPLGLRQGDSNFPLIRQGLIATTIGKKLKDRIQFETNSFRIRELRAFLIDGATVPGSSGSPVLLKPQIGRQQGSMVSLGNAPILLLGIVAETKFAPIETETGIFPGFAGLGLAFDSETIIETIEQFFPADDTGAQAT